MESTQVMISRNGTQGSERLQYCIIDNHLYADWEIDAVIQNMTDRQQKRFYRSLIEVRNVWTWFFDYDRFGNPTLYRQGEHLVNLDGTPFEHK